MEYQRNFIYKEDNSSNLLNSPLEETVHFTLTRSLHC